MTREQASVELVKLFADCKYSGNATDEYAEAIALAIAALSKDGESDG